MAVNRTTTIRFTGSEEVATLGQLRTLAASGSWSALYRLAKLASRLQRRECLLRVNVGSYVLQRHMQGLNIEAM